jgi:hypothetical protein
VQLAADPSSAPNPRCWFAEAYGSRNPMYLAVLAIIFGQAIVFVSEAVAGYGVLTAFTWP